MALNGTLDDYSPAGALRVLSSTGKTGAVRFTGSAGCTAYLADGQLYFARGEGTDDALAAALVRPGRVSPEAWSRAVEEAGDTPRVGELLIEHGEIDPDLMASVVLSVIYDPLITLFREGDGGFDFEPGTMHWIGAYRGFNVEAVVNEVRRRVRHVDEMSDLIPSTSAWVSPVSTLPDGAAQVTLLRDDWELVASLQGARTVDEIAAMMGRGRYSTATVVHRLARAGLLDVVEEPFPPVEDAPHEPSAAERIAAQEDTLAAIGTDVADDPHGMDTDLRDGPDGDLTAEDAGDEAWAAWSDGNPFDHPPLDSDDDDVAALVGADEVTGTDHDLDAHGVVLGPALDGPAGPERDPDDALLPRRTAVRDLETDDLGADDLGGLAGISGFHDPTAAIVGRTNEALSEATSGEDEVELDPNAAWLENLYAQFIDEGEAVTNGKSRKKEALDVAFQAPEQGETEKVGTLKRLAAALRRL